MTKKELQALIDDDDLGLLDIGTPEEQKIVKAFTEFFNKKGL